MISILKEYEPQIPHGGCSRQSGAHGKNSRILHDATQVLIGLQPFLQYRRESDHRWEDTTCRYNAVNCRATASGL